MRTDRHKTARSALLGATALGCSLIVMGAAAPAFAADECGAPVAGVVTCTGTHGAVNYATPTDTAFVVEDGAELGSLRAEGAGDVSVTFEDGAFVGELRVVSSGDVTVSSEATSGVGGIMVSGPAAPQYVAGDVTIDSVAISAAYSGISAKGDKVTIRSGSIVSADTQNSSAGIQVASADTLVITSDDIRAGGMGIQSIISGLTGSLRTADVTSGSIVSGRTGISLVATEAVTVHSDSILAGWEGISVLTGGPVVIVSDDVETTGDDADGIIVNGDDTVDITSGSIVTAGEDSDGIDVTFTAGPVTIDSGVIATTGADSDGITVAGADGSGAVTVVSGVVTTTGEASRGIKVNASGDVVIDSGSVITGGERSVGIQASASAGSVTVDSDVVSTSGFVAVGISAEATGDVTVRSGTVRTTGDQAFGIFAYSDPEGISLAPGLTTVRVEADVVTTDGEGATGILAAGEDVIIDVGTLTTTGEGADGIKIFRSAYATVIADTVTTAGEGAAGIEVFSTGDIIIDAGSVSTTGDESRGIDVYADNGGTITMGAEAITTASFGSIGAVVETTGAAYADIGDISTAGGEASGVEVYADTAWVRVGNVTTTGSAATGVVVATSTEGSIEVDDVTTSGNLSIGIDAASYLGPLTVLSTGQISTQGQGATAVQVTAADTVAMTLNKVKTAGDQAIGVSVTGEGAMTVTAAEVETSGVESHGVYLKTLSDGLDAILDVGTVKTHGDEADGIYVSDDGGDAKISVSADSVTTDGFDADGVSIGFGDDVTLDLGAVKTTGDSSNGVRLGGTDGDFRMKLASVLTEGEGSYGVLMESNFATYDVEIGTATTTGRGATAISTNSTEVEAVKVKAGTVTTSGEGSRGLNLRADLITLDIGAVKTTGADAAGIVMRATNTGNPGRLTMTGEVDSIETTGAGSAGMTLQTTGNVDLDIGALTTRGANSAGLSGTSTGGGVLDIGTVLTEGVNSAGVVLSANTGGFDFEVERLETRGADSTGLLLTSKAASSVDANVVRTSGDRSTAVQATVTAGNLVLTSDDIRTTGLGADGVVASASGDATLNLGLVDVTGSEADAVTATAGGALKVTTGRRLGSASGVAASLTGGAVDLSVASSGVVAGGSAGLVLNAQTTSTVTNAGSISSTSGLAIQALSGSTTINNSGTILGRLGFAGGADTINNSHLMQLSGVNDFGGGNDVFNNAATGVLSILPSSGPLSLTNLETFNNAGLIDLANGVAGDVLSISGTLNSTAGSRIQLDVSLAGATPVADRINVGALTGTSVLQVQMQGQGRLGETGVTLVDSAAGQTGQEFTVQTIDGGFLDYDLAYDAATSSYQLVGELAVQAFEPTKVASGAQTQWRKGADVVTARLADLRDGHALTGPNRGQVWAQGFGGEESLDGRNNLSGTGGDLSVDVTTQGVQIGADVEQAFAGGQATIGGVIGAGRTKLTFDGNGDRSEFESTSVGVYGQWTQGPLTIGGLVKGEFHDLTYDWASADLSDEADGETWGAMLNVSARLPLAGAWFAEPDAGLTWNTTDLDGISDAAGTVTFGDTESLIGRFGLRTGATIRTASGAVVQPYAGLHVNREFDGDNRSTLTLGAAGTEVADEGRRTWAEAALGVNVQGKAGLGGFAQVEALGGDIEGYGVRIGARFSW